MQPPMKCIYFYVLALTLAFPRDVRHVCPVVESVTSWGARCTRRVLVVPDVPLTLNKRKRARELLSQHIFGHNIIHINNFFTCCITYLSLFFVSWSNKNQFYQFHVSFYSDELENKYVLHFLWPCVNAEVKTGSHFIST